MKLFVFIFYVLFFVTACNDPSEDVSELPENNFFDIKYGNFESVITGSDYSYVLYIPANTSYGEIPIIYATDGGINGPEYADYSKILGNYLQGMLISDVTRYI